MDKCKAVNIRNEAAGLYFQKAPVHENLDHPDICYVNYPLKLKQRYLFRIMVYTYSATYLCMNFKHYTYRIFLNYIC